MATTTTLPADFALPADFDRMMVALCYWAGVSECVCGAPRPIGGCLRRDMRHAIETVCEMVGQDREGE